MLLARPGATGKPLNEPGAIVGIVNVDTEILAQHLAQHLDCPVGAVLHTVEFGDGSDALLPEDALRAVVDQSG